MAPKVSKKLRALRDKLERIRGFKCKEGCFECCTAVDYTEEEEKRMMRSLRKQGHKEPPNGKGKGYCKFLDKDGKCSVYRERPIICRAFGKVETPFLRCSYNRDHDSPRLFAEFINYGKQPKVSNGHKGFNWKEKLESGDPKALLLMAQITTDLYRAKEITEEETHQKLEILEERMNAKGDSLTNYKGKTVVLDDF